MPESQLINIRRPMPDLSFQIAGLFAQGRSAGIQINVDEPGEFFDLNLIKANVARVEILQMFGFRSAHQLTIKLIYPGMIGTHDARCLTFTAQQLVGAVLADVVESPQLTIAISDNCNWLTRDRHGDVSAGIAQFLDVTDPLPGLGKDVLLIDGEPVIPRVGVGLQGQGISSISGISLLYRRKLLLRR